MEKILVLFGLLIIIGCAEEPEEVFDIYEGHIMSFYEEEGVPSDFMEFDNLLPLEGVSVRPSYYICNEWGDLELIEEIGGLTLDRDCLDGERFYGERVLTDSQGRFVCENEVDRNYAYSVDRRFSSAYNEADIWYQVDKTRAEFKFFFRQSGNPIRSESVDAFVSHSIVEEIPSRFGDDLRYYDGTFYMNVLANINLDLHFRYEDYGEYQVESIYTGDTDRVIEVYLD